MAHGIEVEVRINVRTQAEAAERKGGEFYCCPCEPNGGETAWLQLARAGRCVMTEGGVRRRASFAILTAMGALIVIVFAGTVAPQPLAPKPHYLGAEPDPSASSISGVRLRAVNPRSSAEKAGLQSGDILVKLGNVAITKPEDLTVALKSTTPGQPAEVVYVRQGEEFRAQVSLEPRR